MKPSPIESGVSPKPGAHFSRRLPLPEKPLLAGQIGVDYLAPLQGGETALLQTLSTLLQPQVGLDDLLPVAPDRPSVPAKYSVYWVLGAWWLCVHQVLLPWEAGHRLLGYEQID